MHLVDASEGGKHCVSEHEMGVQDKFMHLKKGRGGVCGIEHEMCVQGKIMHLRKGEGGMRQ